MTGREHVRPLGRGREGGRDPEQPRLPPPGERVSDRLLAAREAKGVDLLRAERETKIRRQYLAAMEHGDWAALPAGVYARGFLRNYAVYLGLDPDEIVDQWHREGGAPPPAPSIVEPHPIEAPRRGLVLGPGVIVAVLVAIGAVAIVAYIAFQLMRFEEPPKITVTEPAAAVIQVAEDSDSYTLRGTTVAQGEVTVKTTGSQDIRVLAGDDGTWRADVALRRGENHFVVSAVDPRTGKQAVTPAEIVITVPFAQVAAPTLELASPEEGSSVENGAIPVVGTTKDATSLTVSAAYVGPAPGQPAAPSSAPSAVPTPKPIPATSVPLADDGSFTSSVDLTAGRWTIMVTAAGDQGKSTTLTRTVAVVYKGISVVIEIRGERTWLKVWVDGTVSPETGSGGKVYPAGKTLTFTGKSLVEVRTGRMSSTLVSVNGTSYGPLGTTANPGTFRLQPNVAPRAAQ